MNEREERCYKKASVIVFIIANILYLIMAVGSNFNYDEAYTVGMIERTFGEIIDITSHDVHTPFYYFILKLFHMTLGMEQLISSKIFSWIFMVGYLLLGAYICRRHYDRRVEFFWMLFSCFMPAMMIQATNARMYTFALFEITLAAYLAYLLFQEESRWKWILFTISSILSVYTHTFTMITMVVIYALFIVTGFVRKRYKKVVHAFASGIIVSCFYLPWLLILWRQFSRWAGWESGWGNTIEELSLRSLYSYLAEWFSSLENPQPLVILSSILILLVAAFYMIKYVRQTKDWLPCLGVVVAAIVFVLAMLVSLLIVPCFLGRYVFPLFGGLWLFAAVGITRMSRKWVPMLVAAMVVVMGGFAFVEEMRLEDSEGVDIYRECMQEYEEDDIIMADSYYLMMMSLYDKNAEYMIYGFKSEVLPFGNCEAFTSWEQLEDVGTVWYLSLKDFRIGNIDEYYECEYRKEFSYSYYDIVLEKYNKK
ncbi:MAG: glycosyltransferase family 39 protein [Lachnospiraceae bacterium]|nr:glycosyltransferase family 39 protein [Lachnospiraceae bacterium]